MGLRYKKIIVSTIISVMLLSLPVIAQEEDENPPVRNMDEFVEKTVNKISKVIPFISGYVIYKKDNDIYIDLGRKQSVIQDMEFEVYREGKDIKHPVRDEYTGKVEEKIGELKTKILRDTLSITEAVNLIPDRQVEAGDKVYSKKRWDKIAILPIANPKKEQNYFTKILYDLIRDKIVHTTSLTIITKNDVEKALYDLGLENSNNFLSDKAVRAIGNKLKAEIIIFGNLLDIGENLFLTLRFANSEDGSTFFVVNTELKKERSLRALIYTMSQTEEAVPVEKKMKIIKAPLFYSTMVMLLQQKIS
ncbi:hypothetical protein HY745_08515 [Candidatus Desantisbacteria bacterium]|nr:hypothetical protein [Candidatus Desantisbacteria bacterium]